MVQVDRGLTGVQSPTCPVCLSQVQVWDTAGQERFRKSMVKHYYHNVHAVVFVYDVTNMASFCSLQTWIEVWDLLILQFFSFCVCVYVCVFFIELMMGAIQSSDCRQSFLKHLLTMLVCFQSAYLPPSPPSAASAAPTSTLPQAQFYSPSNPRLLPVPAHCFYTVSYCFHTQLSSISFNKAS